MASEKELSRHSESFCFDPAEYVKAFYSGSYSTKFEEQAAGWIRDEIHNIFAMGKIRGHRLLDIGSGPVVYPVITASKWFEEIYVSDIARENVEFIQKWIKGESDHMQPLMKEFALKEGESISWTDKNSQVRSKVKAAVEWDMHKPEMLSLTAIENLRFDAVTACACLSAANVSIESYKQVLRNIRNILNPGGVFVVVDLLDETWYEVDGKRFSVFAITAEEIKTSVVECGYEIESFETFEIDPNLECTMCDAKNMYSMVIKKVLI